MTKAELQKQVAEQAARIAELEEEIADLETELRASEEDAVFGQDAADHFTALCAALDERLPFRVLPVRLQLDFEDLAQALDVTLPLRRA